MPTGLGDEQLWISATNDNTGTSTAFNDQSGNGNNGTAIGTIVVADTTSGGSYAYEFDGSNDYIDVVSSGVPAAAYSVSLWQYSTNSGVNTAFNAGQVGGERTVNIDGVRAATFGDSHGHKRGGTSYFVSSNVVRSSATWYHYLLTYDGSELKLYVNGTYVGNKTGVPNTDWIEDRCWVGQYIGGSFFFQGRMDDIRTYDRALTQAEIVHLAASRGVEGGPDNCGLKTDITYWSDLSDGTSASLSDSSGGPDVLTRNGGSTDSTGSPRSSACVNYSNVATNYHTLNGGANIAAPTSEYSVSVWSYFGSASPTFGNWVANQRDASTGDHWQIFRWNTGNIAVHELGSITRSVEVLSNLGQWYHISFSRTDAALSVYVNGSLVGTDTSSITQNTGASPIALGTAAWDQGNSSTHNNGSQWAFGMWDRELSASEHWQLYQAGSGLLYSEFCPTPPAGGFYNPFINKTFNQNYTRRIG